MKTLFSTIAIIILTLFYTRADAAERPNIVWISCEDISAHLGCYGDPNATTPRLDGLATQGVRYTNAYTCHGVCAPSRTGIITGMHPISLGANHMRSKANLPDHVKCFPQYLREAGYYCTNNSKTDYNLNWPQKLVWDESSNRAHWKNRPSKEKPFFAVFNLTMTHESKIWPEGWAGVVRDLPETERHDPSKITVPELYPDTDEVRNAFARLLDIITVMDKRVGELLDEIDQAGLADDTIVIFWSDHGNGFPRAKRWVYDTGTRVPMIARIPEKWRVGEQGQPGSVDDRLINLIDLGPTVLNLTGIATPEHMHGQAFLGRNLPENREFVHASRDRVDERMDMVRSVRDNRFRYVRNLMPWRCALQNITYSERSVVRQEMRRLLADGTLKPESAQFFQAPRAPEELYDLQNDPWELHNLADSPAHRESLQRLRSECDRWQLESGDAHLLPESLLAQEEDQIGNRWQILHGQDGDSRTQRLLNLAKVASTTAVDGATLIQSGLKSEDAVERWWSMMALAHQTDAGEHASVFRFGMHDPDPTVRIAAARGLRLAGLGSEAWPLLANELKNESSFVQYAAILEIDESGIDAIRVAAPLIRELGKSEYVGRLAVHSLEQLPTAGK
ncbi:MAG: sulfatase-like hydrolase/transferase [Planctomycetaceae bacterium]|nr:sulfatase-like hydrolase/transferase [Planctomycetaceae bacterium]